MSFDDLGLLLGVIEIQMVLHMLVYDIRFDVLWHLHFYVSILIHSPYTYLKCEIALVLTWHHSMYYDYSILYLASCATWSVHRLWSALVWLYLLLARLGLFTALCHNALVTTHVYSIMVFVTGVDVTFSWLISTPILRWVALVIHIFIIVDDESVMLVIIDDYSCSCGFCT
jgi:hypothetical protein